MGGGGRAAAAHGRTAPGTTSRPSQGGVPMRTHALALTVATGVLAGAAPASAATITVGVYSDYFAPPDATATVGDTIDWHWYGSGHDVHVTSGPGSGLQTPFHSRGADEARVFDAAGSYTFVCDAHSGMRGTLTVLAAPAPVVVGIAGRPAPAPAIAAPEPAPDPSPLAALATVAPVTPAVDTAAPVLSAVSARRGVLRLRVNEDGQLTVAARRTRGKRTRTRAFPLGAGANAVALRSWLGAG